MLKIKMFYIYIHLNFSYQSPNQNNVYETLDCLSKNHLLLFIASNACKLPKTRANDYHSDC